MDEVQFKYSTFPMILTAVPANIPSLHFKVVDFKHIIKDCLWIVFICLYLYMIDRLSIKVLLSDKVQCKNLNEKLQCASLIY